MTTAPAGYLSTSIDALANLVANSATFIAATGAASAAAAKTDSVYWPGQQPYAETGRGRRKTRTWPDVFAWVLLPEGFQLMKEATGGGSYVPGANLILWLQRSYAEGTSEREKVVQFTNFIGNVVEDMAALSKTEGYLWVTSFEVQEINRNGREEPAANYLQAAINVRVM